jgi:hypothetical protein
MRDAKALSQIELRASVLLPGERTPIAYYPVQELSERIDVRLWLRAFYKTVL